MRNIPAPLATYMEGNGLHMCKITKAGPFPDGSFRYFADLTRNLVYDDGDGEATYIGRSGAQLSTLVSTAGLGVDNAEATTLPVTSGTYLEGFTTDQVRAGELDAVPYVTYCLSYVDTSLGHFIWASGTIGEVRLEGTSLINFEMTSISKLLRQMIGDTDSTRCRAIFGSQPLGTGGGVREERFPCTYNLTPEWVSATITGLHPTDVDLIFYSTDLTQATDYFHRGMVRGVTGVNAGIEREIDTYTFDGVEAEVRLAFPFPYNPETGDEFEIRRGCRKEPYGNNSCSTFFGSSWVLKYRGEPEQPVGDAAGNLIAGVSLAGDLGGTGEPVAPSVPPVDTPGGGAGNDSAVVAPVRDWGPTVYNVVDDYGAVGDGVTDDTDAFNDAFNALPGDGGTVYAPPGLTFLIDPDTMIRPTSKSRLLMAASSKLKASYTAVDHRYVIYINGKSEVEIEGVTIEGYRDLWSPIAGTTSEWGHGIAILNGSTAVTVRDSTIYKCVGDAISIGYSCSDVWVDNCLLTQCRRQGISNGGDDFHAKNCEISYINGTSPEAGIDNESDDGQSAVGIDITDNHIHHCDGPGVLMWQRSTDATIDDNILEYNSHGILCNDSDTASITNNMIRHNRNWGIRFQNTTAGYDINGNTLYNNMTVENGVVTYNASNLTSRTGTSSYTEDHIRLESGTSANVGTNLVGP